MGEAVAAAAELAERARGEILVDEVARELLGGFTLHEGERGWRLEARKSTSRGQHRLSSFVGRRQVVAELARRLADAFQARMPRAVVLLGAPGQGKTRLSHELLSEVHQRHPNMRLLSARGDRIGAGAPLALAAMALRGALRIHARDAVERQQALLEGRLRQLGLGGDSWVAAFLGALLGLPCPPRHAEVLAASMRDAAVMADGMRSAFCTWLQAEGRAGEGVTLLLDDVQWGDYPSLRLVEHALQTLEGTPLFVFMLARPEVAQVFPQLTQRWHTVELGGLASVDAEALVRQALGAGADAQLVARLVAQGAGNPFYLQELARAARTDATRIPETVLSAAEAHLQRLDPVARRVLRAASVFGQIFWPSGLLALLGDWHADEVVSWLPALVDLGLIELRLGAELHGEVGYRFHHELLREAAYAMLSERDRQGGHRLAAEWLERHHGAPPLALAEQWVRGGAPANAVTHYHRAAVQALSGNDFHAVIDYADRAIACGARREMRGELSLLAAEALEWATDDEARAIAAADALAHLPKGSDKWFSALHHAVTARLRAEGPSAVTELVDELHALSARMLPAEAEIVALARVSGYLTMYGDIERGRQAFQRAENRVRALEVEPPLATGWLSWARSWQCHERADMAASLEHDLTSMFAFEGAGDQRNLCYARSNVGYAQMRLGLLEAAEKSLRQALATAERLDLRTIASGAAHNLGLVLALLGNAEQAELMQHRALAFFLQLKSGRGEAIALEYLARSYLMAGRLEDAERSARRAYELAQQWPSILALTAASLARVLLEKGEVALARDFAEMALARFEAAGSADGEEQFIRAAYVEVMAAAGQHGDARRVAMQGRLKLEELASAITNESIRLAFLTRVPEHHRLLELARTLWV
jgi:tetratricopeptide (TPR) repeat protein